MQRIAGKANTVVALAIGAASLMATTVTPAEAAADRVIRRCEADGPGDISMHARFERRDNGRRKFTIEMEAAPNGAFEEGQRVVFFVAGKNVGNDRLFTVAGGDLVGELNLDTTAGPNDPDEDPFPPNFPPVNNGTRVQIKSGGSVVLGCTLR